jgi:micrococcal nuclease
MTQKKKLIAAYVIISLIAVFTLNYLTGSFVKKYPRYKATITSVIDGDTVTTENGEKVRLLGINAPEKGQFYYEEAKRALERMVGNKSVELEIDTKDKDAYGRSLRYIFVDDSFVNLEMVKSGYAHTYIIYPNVRYKALLTEAQNFAREKKLGIWKPSVYLGCVIIQAFSFDDKNEFVEFKSVCDSLNVSGWYVTDESSRNVFYFPSILLSDIVLHTGYGKSNSTDLFWDSSPVWNDDGDTIFLRDTNGLLVLSYSYP